MGRPFEEVSAEVIGAALAVHRELGPGFLESIYHEAMRVSLAHRSIPFESQVPVDVCFEGELVGRARIDLVVAGEVIVELKAVESIRDVHFVQLKSYLRATRAYFRAFVIAVAFSVRGSRFPAPFGDAPVSTPT